MSAEVFKCVISGEVIPAERVEALQSLGVPRTQWTVVKHSKIQRRQGIYTGEAGTSELLLCSKVYNDSVRSVFRGASKQVEAEQQAEDGDEVEEDEGSSSSDYSSTEMAYYDETTESPEKVDIVKRQDG